MNTDALTWPEPAPSLARSVSGEFRLLREIGRGGMGVVFLAEDMQLHRRVAIKTLPPHLAADAGVRERFLREARTAAALSHPNIVPIYSAAERGGVVYFTMGYVDGESLAERLQREILLSADTCVAISRQLALALIAAHAEGVVHRDIKAENVLLDGAGRALVTDFGIARLSEAQPLTATGTVLGTVQYMSPEQVTGDALDGRSDLYALGVLLFRMLTGRFPFERNTASAVLVAHVNSAPPRVHEYRPDAPDALDALVASLLEKRAADRVPSAQSLLQQLDLMAGGAHVPMLAPSSSLGGGGPSSARLSSLDAEAVWARAAQLQANTGMVVPPAQFPEPSETASPTRGYDVDVVKDAAAEAGIAPKYVERALAERQAAAAPAILVVPGPQLQKKPNIFLGAHTKLDFESVVEGELPFDGLEDIAELARRTFGNLITVSAVGRTLTISCESNRTPNGVGGRRMQITVAVRHGRTTIRAFEDLSQTAGGFGGLGGGLGAGLGAAILGVSVANHSPVTGLLLLPVILSVSVAGARALFGRISRTKSTDLRETVEAMAKLAQAQIQRASLPNRGPTSRVR